MGWDFLSPIVSGRRGGQAGSAAGGLDPSGRGPAAPPRAGQSSGCERFSPSSFSGQSRGQGRQAGREPPESAGPGSIEEN